MRAYAGFIDSFDAWLTFPELPVERRELERFRQSSQDLLDKVREAFPDSPELAVQFHEELEMFCSNVHFTLIGHHDGDEDVFNKLRGTLERHHAENFERLFYRAMAYKTIYGVPDDGTGEEIKLHRQPRPNKIAAKVIPLLQQGIDYDTINERTGASVSYISVLAGRYKHLLNGKPNTR
jgi:hypothetical protein